MTTGIAVSGVTIGQTSNADTMLDLIRLQLYGERLAETSTVESLHRSVLPGARQFLQISMILLRAVRLTATMNDAVKAP